MVVGLMGVGKSLLIQIQQGALCSAVPDEFGIPKLQVDDRRQRRNVRTKG